MAYVATTTDLSVPHNGMLTRAASALGRFLNDYMEARSHHGEFEALERLTDAELAERGLTRDGIARHVFADSFYL